MNDLACFKLDIVFSLSLSLLHSSHAIDDVKESLIAMPDVIASLIFIDSFIRVMKVHNDPKNSSLQRHEPSGWSSSCKIASHFFFNSSGELWCATIGCWLNIQVGSTWLSSKNTQASMQAYDHVEPMQKCCGMHHAYLALRQ